MRRESVYKIISYLIRSLTRMEAEGVENVPVEGGCILVTNHMSRVDVPLLLIATPRSDLAALVTTKYRSNPLFAFLIHATGSIWIDRSKADFTAFRAALDYIAKGGMLGIAPEGTRSRNGKLLEGKPGTVLLAEKAQVAIIPAGIIGSDVVMRGVLTLSRPPLKVRYGKPFFLSPIDRSDREASLQRNTDEIMCRIAALLPPTYHGFYAGHPRLQELLALPEEVT
jgi:1-acyl-sn-glycerol-3-phosphate acyltransferase